MIHVILRREHDPVRRRVDARHVERLPARDADPLALADRDRVNPPVAAEESTRPVDGVAGAIPDPLREKAPQIAVRNEADVLALARSGRVAPEPRGDRPRRFLRQIAEREDRPAENAHGDPIQEIRLVLRGVGGRGDERRAPRAGDEPGVVSRRDCAAAELVGGARERGELDELVAGDAGIGRPAPPVFRDERAHDPPRERRLDVDHAMRDARPRAEPPRAAQKRVRAAGASPPRGSRVAVEPERHADDLEPALAEQPGRRRAVNAAAHADDDAFVHVR